MGVAEFTLGAIIASTIASVGTSVAMANQANKQQAAMAEYQNRQRELAYAKSMAFNRASQEVKAAELKRNLQMKYDLMRGASEAQGAERNVLESRVQEAVLNSLGYAVAREGAKIETEKELGLLGQSINQAPQWVVGSSESTFLTGLQGGIQGFMNGLNMAGAYSNIQGAQAASQAYNAYGGAMGVGNPSRASIIGGP